MPAGAFSVPTLGQTLGHYRLVEHIGEGGMGVVYRAHDQRLDRSVALKVLPAGTLANEAARKRFRKEALALAKLNHPSIESVYDFDTQEGVDFLVMEYIPGVTLRDKLAVGPLPEKEVAHLGWQLAEGLASAHEQGVIHRDLKPGNLRLTPEGRLKILDFGLAKLVRPLGEATTIESMTETSSAAGTLPYMAPEQLLGEDVDARTDIYAAGTVLYEMATGQRPFHQELVAAVVDHILHQPPPLPSTINRCVSPSLETILLKALEKDPANRYQSAKELLVDLRRLAAAAATSVAVRPRREAVRFWRVGVACVTFLTLVATLTALNVGGLQDWFRQRIWPGSSNRIPIAVLPFVNKTGDDQLEKFRDVLTQTLVGDLIGSQDVSVLPYERLTEITGSMEKNGKDIYRPDSIRVVADWSNAQFMVVPTMFRVGTTMSVSAEIRNARSGETIANLKVDRTLSGSGVEPFYNAVEDLSRKIQKYFQTAGLGSKPPPRPASYRPKTVTATSCFYDGKNAVAGGNYAQALNDFRCAVREDQEYALAYAWIGQVYGLLGDDSKALEASEKAAKKISAQTPLADVYFIQANLSERKYDYPAATEKYLELIRFAPDDPVWLDNLASVYEREGKIQMAVASETDALRKDPKYIAAYQRLASLYSQSRDWNRALDHALKAVNLSRSLGNAEAEAGALCALGTTRWYRGEYQQARENLLSALLIFGKLENERGIARANKLLGDTYFSEWKYKEALDSYQKVLSRSGEIRDNRIVAVALMNSGAIYHTMGKYAEAMDYYQQSLQVAERFHVDRRSAETMSNLGSLLIERGPDPTEGLKRIQRALSFFEATGVQDWEAFAHTLIGKFHCNAGHHLQGMDQLRRSYAIASAAEDKSELARAAYNMARCQFFQDQYSLARDSLNQALDLYRNRDSKRDLALAQILAGRIDLRLGEFDKARVTLTTAVGDAEKNHFNDLLPEGYSALGELAYHQVRNDEARKNFERSVGLGTGALPDASSVEAKSYLGLLLAQKGKIPQGLADCQASLDYAEKMGRADLRNRGRLHLARVYLSQNSYVRAIEVLGEMPSQDEQSLGLDMLAQVWDVQSQALKGLGKTGEAERAYEKAREAARKLARTIPESGREALSARADIRSLLR